MFNLKKLLREVFVPAQGEKVLIMVDLPHGDLNDDRDWRERRTMAEEWRDAFQTLGVDVYPLLIYFATGLNNADLPENGTMNGEQVFIADMLSTSHIAIALTEFSATAPLSHYLKRVDHLRVASMPGVLKRMEQSALCVDVQEMAHKTHLLADLLTKAVSAEVTFSTGHVMMFDLRYRRGFADDGLCISDQEFPLINLPSGEAFIVPYEGEKEGEPSLSRGIIPIQQKDERILYHVEQNQIKAIEGEGTQAHVQRNYFDGDPARRNIAELGLGCNDKAIITGNVLEDEKAGFHWAYGRSEHLGGTVGPEAFTRADLVVHQDIVYAPGSPIEALKIILRFLDGGEKCIFWDGEYRI
ncbi:MAG: hypothetical protein GKR87_02760 [Kiritimatiellae bacterium]|nr:hypothetical protein [Kiritimatiellia bacterium]